MMHTTYTRTVSLSEATEGHIMVLKDHLSLFPMIGTQFELRHGSTVHRVRVETSHCECRGPEKPHDHYFIRWNNLAGGEQIVIRRDMKKPGRYHLQIRSVVAQQGSCG